MRFYMLIIILIATSVGAKAEGYRSIEEVVKTSKLVNGFELLEMEAILSQAEFGKSPPVILFRHDDESIAYSGVVAGYENNFDQCVMNAFILNRQSRQTGVEYLCLNRGDYTRMAFGELKLGN